MPNPSVLHTVPWRAMDRLVYSFIALFLIGLLGFVLLIVLGSRSLDEHALADSRDFAQLAFEDQKADLGKFTKDYAWWDEMIENTLLVHNEAWIEKTTMPYLYQSLGIEYAFIFDRNGKQLLSIRRDAWWPEDVRRHIRHGLPELLQQAADRAGKDEPFAVGGLLEIDGSLVLVEACVMMAEEPGSVMIPQDRQGSILVFAKLFSADSFSVQARNVILQNLRIGSGPNDGEVGGMPLVAMDGTRLGHLYWTIDKVGQGIFGKVMPMLLLLLAVVVSLALIVISNALKARNRLRIFNAVFEQTAETIVIADAAMRVVYANPAFSMQTGYALEDVIGWKLPGILVEGGAEHAVDPDMVSRLQSGDSWMGKVMGRCKDGDTFPGMMSVVPLKTAKGTISHYVGLLQNLTAYDHLEKQLRQTQKMEAIGTLVGGIAHEFNNILAGMTGNIYLARARTRALPDVQQKLQSIERLIFQAANLIRQMLAFARKERVCMHALSLSGHVRESFGLLRKSVPEHIAMDLHVCHEALVIHGDDNQCKQVLMNLVNNARDAVQTSIKPRIVIRVEPFETAKPLVTRYGELKAGSYAHLSVADNGCGIPSGQIEHLFEPFFTTKDPGKGSGLGLSMVFGVVQTHGGMIDVQSCEGAGSTFHLYIPLLKEQGDLAPAAEKEPAGNILRGHGETILLVDDDAQILKTGQEVLESLGYRVLLASDGAQGIEVFSANPDRVALVIMDIVMPTLGGVEAAEEIRRLSPDVRVVFATGYEMDAELPGGALPQGEAVLSKPYDVETLSAAIRKALATE